MKSPTGSQPAYCLQIDEIECMRRAGKVVAEVLREMQTAVEVGISTAELDLIANQICKKHGALSGPQEVYQFPGFTCISLNEEAVHGIPGSRRLKSGDLVKLDVTPQLDGWIADACITVGVGVISNQSRRLMDCSRYALDEAIKIARPGLPVHQIGKAVQAIVEGRGFRVLRQLCGHGVGRTIHEEPVIPNFYEPRFNAILKAGMTLTIEPIISESTDEVNKAADGWTLVTKNGCNSAHFEHTLLITEGEPEILTV